MLSGTEQGHRRMTKWFLNRQLTVDRQGRIEDLSYKLTDMDTDDLSIEAYRGIIIEAENLHHDLTLQFGLLSSECSNEDEFLEKVAQLIDEFKPYKSEDLPDIFFDDIPDLKSFKSTLKKILTNIEKIREIPLDKRRFEG